MVIDDYGVSIVVTEIYRPLKLVITHYFLYHFHFVTDEQYNCEIVFYIP